MIKKHELRIGNIVNCHSLTTNFNAAVLEVRYGGVLVQDGEYNNTYGYDNISPIEISPEILEKAGFELMWEGRWQKCLVDVERTQFGFVLLNGEERSAWAHSYLFLHELQNLYHALTGEELTIQL